MYVIHCFIDDTVDLIVRQTMHSPGRLINPRSFLPSRASRRRLIDIDGNHLILSQRTTKKAILAV
jgi:hypothetical protein